jgi:hydrogenase-1 operon protein HyaF
MKDFPVAVRMIGPGSQPVDEDELEFLAMPREMATFRMPSVPQRVAPAPLARARDALASLVDAMKRWDPASGVAGPRLDLRDVDPDALLIVNQMLGEGEVSIIVSGERTYRIQESVFTGLWRVVAHDGRGASAGDWIEVSSMPEVVADAARDAAGARVAEVALPPGAMNSPALLAEIAAQLEERRPDGAAHVINLTLFPMTADDHRVLENAFPVGPVAIMSRGFGNCRVTSTGTRNVWRVQYFNNMNTLILNTIEVVGLPEVALAAVEDLEDTRTRLADLVAWMSESCAPLQSPVRATAR